MPYVVVPPVDRASRAALADACWTGMRAAKPDLEAAISLQIRLIRVVEELVDSLAARPPLRLSLPQKYLTTKLMAGIPALTNEPIPLPFDLLGLAFNRLCQTLAESASGEATRLLAAAAREGQLNVAPLLVLTLRREQGAVRVAATKAGLGHDLLWLVSDLAVGPFAHAQLGSLFDHAAPESPLRNVLRTWERGYCPLCGSWPAFLECANSPAVDHQGTAPSEDGPSEASPANAGDMRALRSVARCAFCAAAWDLSTASCVYCAKTDEQVVTLTPDPSRPNRQVVGCHGCRGYIKIVDAVPLPFPLLPLTDLNSMDLDLVAMQTGFARPALKQFGRKR